MSRPEKCLSREEFRYAILKLLIFSWPANENYDIILKTVEELEAHNEALEAERES